LLPFWSSTESTGDEQNGSAGNENQQPPTLTEIRCNLVAPITSQKPENKRDTCIVII
jgi:hypothetical protein